MTSALISLSRCPSRAKPSLPGRGQSRTVSENTLNVALKDVRTPSLGRRRRARHESKSQRKAQPAFPHIEAGLSEAEIAH
jgi:hypothetical protein